MRLVLIVLFCTMAAYTQFAWGDDPHLDFPPVDESFEGMDDMEFFPMEGESGPLPVDNSTLEVPSKPRKPSVPMLFGAASEMLQSWREAELHPQKPAAPKPTPAAPARALASVPEDTRRMTESELDKEGRFQDDVLEASVGGEVPQTYRKILNALQTGRITPRPVKDTGH